MAVVENAGGGGKLSWSVEIALPLSNHEPSSGGEINDHNDQTKLGLARHHLDHRFHHDQSLYVSAAAEIGAHNHNHHHHHGSLRSDGGDFPMNGDHHHQNFNRDMRALTELFSKLNPMAKEFVPPSLSNGNDNNNHQSLNDAAFINGGGGGFLPNNGNKNGNVNVNGVSSRRRSNQGKKRMNSRTSMAQREDRIQKTVYVSDIDQQVTEEQLAALFITCGHVTVLMVVDYRICGDPNSVLRFAFIEFTDEVGAHASVSLAGKCSVFTQSGFYRPR